MAQGTTIDNSTSPRKLKHNGEGIAVGGTANQAGLYAVGTKLYVDGLSIAEASADELGILDKVGVLNFRGTPIGGSTPPTPPDPPTPPEPVESDLWIPPVQASSSRNKYTYRSFIEAYDALRTNDNNGSGALCLTGFSYGRLNL